LLPSDKVGTLVAPTALHLPAVHHWYAQAGVTGNGAKYYTVTLNLDSVNH
jgi:hypothetical protein